jgi:hypothetical protein
LYGHLNGQSNSADLQIGATLKNIHSRQFAQFADKTIRVTCVIRGSIFLPTDDFPSCCRGNVLTVDSLKNRFFNVAVLRTFAAVCVFFSTNIVGANAPLYFCMQIFHLLYKRHRREIFVENQPQIKKRCIAPKYSIRVNSRN